MWILLVFSIFLGLSLLALLVFISAAVIAGRADEALPDEVRGKTDDGEGKGVFQRLHTVGEGESEQGAPPIGQRSKRTPRSPSAGVRPTLRSERRSEETRTDHRCEYAGGVYRVATRTA